MCCLNAAVVRVNLFCMCLNCAVGRMGDVSHEFGGSSESLHK